MAVQRLARNTLKNAMEMERGETADAGQPDQRKFAVEIFRDVVEHAIDPIVIVLVAPHAGSHQYVQPNSPGLRMRRDLSRGRSPRTAVHPPRRREPHLNGLPFTVIGLITRYNLATIRLSD